jgi:hypothetical protein
MDRRIKSIRRKEDFAALLPVIIGFMAGCNLTALFLLPWSWLLAAQLVLWLITLCVLVSIQQRQAARRRAVLMKLAELAGDRHVEKGRFDLEQRSEGTTRLRPPSGVDPSRN